MLLPIKLSRIWIACFLCAVGFGAVAALVGDRKIAAFDRTLIDAVQGLEAPRLTSVMKFFTSIGAGAPAIAIAAAVAVALYGLKRRRELVLFLFVLAGSDILNIALKFVFHRARPEIHRLASATGYAFPSGHSMGAFSMYGLLAYLLWKHMPARRARTLLLFACGTLILAIGVSRIYLGVHYPSDVLAGYLASGCWLTASIWTYRKFAEKATGRRR